MPHFEWQKCFEKNEKLFFILILFSVVFSMVVYFVVKKKKSIKKYEKPKMSFLKISVAFSSVTGAYVDLANWI